jgi:hypothetical protein
MKFNKTAVQHELDMAAHELEKAGFTDLAETVDYYANRLINATAGEVPLLRRALSRILDESKRRIQTAQPKEPTTAESKARTAVDKTRRASDDRKEVLKRRLLEIAAQRKQAAQRLEALRAKRETRTETAATRRERRRERLEQNTK